MKIEYYNNNKELIDKIIIKDKEKKYQEKIRERRAIGECYTPDVMVLCKEGWKCIADVTEEDADAFVAEIICYDFRKSPCIDREDNAQWLIIYHHRKTMAAFYVE